MNIFYAQPNNYLTSYLAWLSVYARFYALVHKPLPYKQPMKIFDIYARSYAYLLT